MGSHPDATSGGCKPGDCSLALGSPVPQPRRAPTRLYHQDLASGAQSRSWAPASNFLKIEIGNSLVVQWLGLHAFTAKGAGSVPGWELRCHKPRSAAQ